MVEGGKWVATFTPRRHTVMLAGPERVFTETYWADGETYHVSVTRSKWVRAAPGPVDEAVDEGHRSILNGTGHYARVFRAVRRL